MAHALTCDACEAYVPLGAFGDLPPSWHIIRVEAAEGSGRSHRTLHACNGGCAIRALASYLHSRRLSDDERERCQVVGCDRPVLPMRLDCATHAPGSALGEPETPADAPAPPPAPEPVVDPGTVPSGYVEQEA